MAFILNSKIGILRVSSKKSLILAAVATLLMISIAGSQAHADYGEVDLSFGSNGIVVTTITGISYLTGADVQPDGKIVIVGDSWATGLPAFVVRYTQDGALDPTFGSNGIVLFDDSEATMDRLDSIVLLPDGRIVVAGWLYYSGQVPPRLFLARYNQDGSIDHSFGSNGVTIGPIAMGPISVKAAVVGNSLKYVVGGMGYNTSTGRDILISRFNDDGSLDTSFGQEGVVSTDLGRDEAVSSLVIQPDGSIVIAAMHGNGYHSSDAFVFARYTPEGELDQSFGNQGVVLLGEPSDSNEKLNSLSLDGDGRIIGVGFHNSPLYIGQGAYAVWRLLSNGDPDVSFGVNGFVSTNVGFGKTSSFAQGVLVLENNDILAGGYTANYNYSNVILASLVSYDLYGNLNQNFGNFGHTVHSDRNRHSTFTRLLLLPDGNVVAAGRYYTQGTDRVSDILLVKYDGLDNLHPVANAGPDQSIECTLSDAIANVTLDGSSSYDPNGDSLNYLWQGIFGIVEGEGPVVSMPLGEQDVTLTVNDGQGGTDSDTVLISVNDTVPPVTEYQVIGTLGTEPWYKSMITLKLDSEDTCSGIANINYKINGVLNTSAEPVTIQLGDGIYQVDFYSLDRQSNSELPQTMTLHVDSSAPDIEIININDNAVYANGLVPIADYVVNDNVSGIASSHAELSGGDGLGLGAFTYTVTASDHAGNTATSEVSYSVIATVDGMIAMVNQAITNNLIQAKFAKNLNKDLVSIKMAPNSNSQDGQLKDFIDKVNNQAGKKINSTFALQIIHAAEYIIANN